MKKKILITGSNGLLGQKLVRQLLTEYQDQFDFVATSTGNNRIERYSGFEYFQMDITSQKQIENILQETNPDIIINTAAMTNVDACEDDKEMCWDRNVNAVKYLLEVSEKRSIHLIHLSTDFIFDGENGPYKETDKPNPLSYYGESKLAAENLLISSDYMNWSIARTIIVYGIADNMSRSNIVLWAKGALEKGQTLTIVDDQFRMPTFADDLAKGCLQIAEKSAFGIYHLSGKDFMSIIEIVETVAEVYQLDASNITPIKSVSLNQKAKRPPKTGFDLSKSIRDLEYNPRSFREGLAQLLKELNN